MITHTKRITKIRDASPKSGQVFGTQSQFVKFFDEDGTPVLMIHQFVRPDGSLGASGKPDPKMILFEGVEYYC